MTSKALKMPQMARDWSAQGKSILCKTCHQVAPMRSPRQFYCADCSDARHKARQAAYSKTDKPKSRQLAAAKIVHDAAGEAGVEYSVEVSRSLLDTQIHTRAQPRWYVRFAMPNVGSASKNFIYGLGGPHGHVYKRQQTKAFQDAVALAVKDAVKTLPVVQNKVWIDLFVQKLNHKSDAVNVVDLICDGVKIGLGVDDRWFSLARLDWEIVKRDPQIFIGIYQEDDFDAQACSCCGQIYPLNCFPKSSGSSSGYGRRCRACSERGRALVRTRRILARAEASL